MKKLIIAVFLFSPGCASLNYMMEDAGGLKRNLQVRCYKADHVIEYEGRANVLRQHAGWLIDEIPSNRSHFCFELETAQ